LFPWRRLSSFEPSPTVDKEVASNLLGGFEVAKKKAAKKGAKRATKKVAKKRSPKKASRK
jgi:hypothetical protein